MDFSRMQGAYTEYRSLLSGFRDRVKRNRDWFHQKQTEFQGNVKNGTNVPTSHSGHIFNAIQYKHADNMDNYPSANILPREEADEESAKVLTEIVPFILERCGFKCAYYLNVYDKLIFGTAAYGVFYNPNCERAGEEIEVKRLEILNLTWQPDACTLNDSAFVFYDTFMSAEDFLEVYGDLEGVSVQSAYDEQKDVTGTDCAQTVVITDCYYKKLVKDKKNKGRTKTVLHLTKFSGNKILWQSEGKKEFSDGFYHHGRYPIVFDLLNPAPGGDLTGFGLVDVAKDMQAYIDRMDEAINQKALLASKDRYFVNANRAVKEDEFLDVNRALVHVEGGLDEDHLKPIYVNPLPSFVREHRNDKIAELKEITGNRDFAQGGTSSGVTAASAITALQTASDKLVRDSVTFSYIAFEEVVRLVVELIREFYDEPRIFRITGDTGKNEYRTVLNRDIFKRGDDTVFDISITVEKNNPYTRAQHNALILELKELGLLDPNNFTVAAFVLKQLNFDGKEKLLRDLEELYEKRQMEVRKMQAQQANEPQGMSLQDGGAPPSEVQAGALVEIPLEDGGAPMNSGVTAEEGLGALVELGEI